MNRERSNKILKFPIARSIYALKLQIAENEKNGYVMKGEIKNNFDGSFQCMMEKIVDWGDKYENRN